MATVKPLVKIIGTGGSIAGVGPDRMDYILYPELGKHLSIQETHSGSGMCLQNILVLRVAEAAMDQREGVVDHS